MRHWHILKNELREMGTILVLLSLPFLILFSLTALKVDVALLKREILVSSYEKEALLKRNAALKDELWELEGDSMDKIYWNRYGALPIYVKNRVVNVKLPDEMSAREPDDSSFAMR